MALSTDRFNFYRWYFDAVFQLKDEKEQIELFNAICNYGFYGIEYTASNPQLNAMFTLIKFDIDRKAKKRG